MIEDTCCRCQLSATHVEVFVWKLAFLQMIAGVHSLNSLTSIPFQINGTLVACVGDEISLTCSHDRVGSASTQWIISSPVNCSTSVGHNPPTPMAPPCGPFSFQNITIAERDVTQLNSTAVTIVNSSTAINGSIVECKAGINMPVSVGNISLCVIDELPKPINLRCMMVPRGLLVTWDVVTDGSSSCARSSIIHNVTVVREADGTIIVTVDDVKDTQIEITDSSLEPRQNYSIHVGTRVLQGTCETGEAANTVCTTSDDLSPTTAPPDTDREVVNGNSVSAAAVAVPIVVIVLFLVIIAAIGILIGYYKKTGKPLILPGKFKILRSGNSSSHRQYIDPSELTHTRAPDGAEYTDINKMDKRGLLPMNEVEEDIGASDNKNRPVNRYESVMIQRGNNGASGSCVNESKDQDKNNTYEEKSFKPDEKENLIPQESIDSKENKEIHSVKDKDEDPKDKNVSDTELEAKDDRPPKPARLSKQQYNPMYEEI